MLIDRTDHAIHAWKHSGNLLIQHLSTLSLHHLGCRLAGSPNQSKPPEGSMIAQTDACTFHPHPHSH